MQSKSLRTVPVEMSGDLFIAELGRFLYHINKVKPSDNIVSIKVNGKEIRTFDDLSLEVKVIKEQGVTSHRVNGKD